MRNLLSVILLIVCCFSSVGANFLRFTDVKFDEKFMDEVCDTEEKRKLYSSLDLSIEISEEKITVIDVKGIVTPTYEDWWDYYEEEDESNHNLFEYKFYQSYFEDFDDVQFAYLTLRPEQPPIAEEGYTQAIIIYRNDGTFYIQIEEDEGYRAFTAPGTETNLAAWEKLHTMLIYEPYRSTEVRDLRGKADLTFDDLFYTGREATNWSEFKKYYPNAKVESVPLYNNSSVPRTLYGHPIFGFGIYENSTYLTKDVSCYIEFGPTGSQQAINEGNRFMEKIYRYLIHRGRNVTMEMGGNSSYPHCYEIEFHEGDRKGLSIGLVDGGLIEMGADGNHPRWGVVIHLRAPLI